MKKKTVHLLSLNNFLSCLITKYIVKENKNEVKGNDERK